MYNKVIFYNHFGAGDIFESREFVKAWMQLVPAKEYFYAHGKSPRILLDIPELQYMEVTERMSAIKPIIEDKQLGILFVNTWIGRDGQYVLPGIGCTVEELYRMHNDILKSKRLGQLPGTPIDYIPTIKYSDYEISKATDFIMKRRGELIYIDNGYVQSMQAENFDFSPMIEHIAETYQDKTFFVTHKMDTNRSNIIWTRDIIGYDGFDLNENSYISLFCTTLIGRNSGPHVFTQVNQNVFDRKKKLLSFTYNPLGASFVVNTDVSINRHWTDATSFDDVIMVMKGVIDL